MDKRKRNEETVPTHNSSSSSTSDALSLVVKKARTDIVALDKGKEIQAAGPPRTSNLSAPILLLSGHEAEIYSVKFSPCGKSLASGSFDKRIFLWDVYGENQNYGVLSGHKNAVLEVHWSTDSMHIFSASADGTAGLWDTNTGRRLRRYSGHSSVVNSCYPTQRGTELLVTGSDDKSAKLWDLRAKNSTHTFEHSYHVTAVCFSYNSDIIFTGSIDNTIRAWDLRKNEVSFKITDHTDTITGLELSPDGNNLLSNSMDNTLHIHDVRPYVATTRFVREFVGVMHGVEQNLLKCSWSPDGSKISAGSSDRTVTVWEAATGKILYKLPGHVATVNEVDFHPTEPILASGSQDKNIYLGEIEP